MGRQAAEPAFGVTPGRLYTLGRAFTDLLQKSLCFQKLERYTEKFAFFSGAYVFA
jgi:hypothetical protein